MNYNKQNGGFMKNNIQTLIILAIIASKFIFDYSLIIMGLSIAAVSILFDMIPHYRLPKKIEKKLVQFLQQNSLLLNEHIQLTIQGNKVNDIMVYYDDEKVGSLLEFESLYPNTYQQFLQCIEDKMKNPITINKPEDHVLPFALAIELIDNYNVDILDEEISQGLYHTSNQLKYLQQLLLEHPKSNNKINKLESYYLPILFDILENYTKVLKTDPASESKLHDKCQKSIFLINEALKNIIQSLFEEEKMNLNADMSVLENLLKKDGLVQPELMEEKR